MRAILGPREGVSYGVRFVAFWHRFFGASWHHRPISCSFVGVQCPPSFGDRSWPVDSLREAPPGNGRARPINVMTAEMARTIALIATDLPEPARLG